MPFDLAIPAFFWTVVKIDIPGDFDQRITGDFKAKFKRLETTEQVIFQKWIDTAGSPPNPAEPLRDLAGEVLPPVSDRAILDRVLLDWDELTLDGRPVRFDREGLDEAERRLGVRAALVIAFMQHGNKAAEGNSAAPRATSSAK